MAEPGRRARLLRELERDFVPDYDAQVCQPATNERPMRWSTSPSVLAGLSKALPILPPPSKQSC